MTTSNNNNNHATTSDSTTTTTTTSSGSSSTITTTTTTTTTTGAGWGWGWAWRWGWYNLYSIFWYNLLLYSIILYYVFYSIILYYIIYIYIYHLSIPNPNVPMFLFTHRPFQPAPARPPWSGYSETPPKPTSPGLRVAWFHTFHWEKTWENRTKPWQNMAGWWLSPTPLKNMSSSMGRMTSHIWNGK